MRQFPSHGHKDTVSQSAAARIRFSLITFGIRRWRALIPGQSRPVPQDRRNIRSYRMTARLCVEFKTKLVITAIKIEGFFFGPTWDVLGLPNKKQLRGASASYYRRSDKWWQWHGAWSTHTSSWVIEQKIKGEANVFSETEDTKEMFTFLGVLG